MDSITSHYPAVVVTGLNIRYPQQNISRGWVISGRTTSGRSPASPGKSRSEPPSEHPPKPATLPVERRTPPPCHVTTPAQTDALQRLLAPGNTKGQRNHRKPPENVPLDTTAAAVRHSASQVFAPSAPPAEHPQATIDGVMSNSSTRSMLHRCTERSIV